MIRRDGPRRLVAVLLASWAAGSPRAQPEAERAVDWAYASYFGTGHYDIGGLESVYALRIGLRKEIRPARLDEDGRTVGITLRAPITVGVYDFDRDDVLGLRFDDVGTVSAVPGVEIEIPLSERWSIMPIAYLGWGSELDGDSSALIYWTGVKAQRRFEAEKIDWALVGSATYVGYTPRSGSSDHIVPVMAGVEFSRPLEDRRIGGDPVLLHWHVAYTRYLDELTYTDAAGMDRIEVDGEWEAGVAFGKQGARLRVWKLRWDRVGVAYHRGAELSGIRIFFRSLFRR